MLPGLLIGLISVSNLFASETKQPNIVFLLIDDLGYADCGFNGGREIQTPNIDRLAKSGAILENLYVQPVCSPTRSALLTGRYPTRTGVYTIVSPHASWGLPWGNGLWLMRCELRDIGLRSRESGTSVSLKKPTSPMPEVLITNMGTSLA